MIVRKKKENLPNSELCHPGRPHSKIKESEKKDNYLDLTRELKNLWNIKVMVISNVIGVLRTIPKGLVRGLEDLEIRGEDKWRLQLQHY